MHSTCTEGPWTLIQHCWDQDPRSHPEASEALQVLLTVSVIARPGDHALVHLPPLRIWRKSVLEAVDQRSRRRARTYSLGRSDPPGLQSGQDGWGSL